MPIKTGANLFHFSSQIFRFHLSDILPSPLYIFRFSLTFRSYVLDEYTKHHRASYKLTWWRLFLDNNITLLKGALRLYRISAR